MKTTQKQQEINRKSIRGYSTVSIRKAYENHRKTYENYMKTIQKQQAIHSKSIGGTL